MIQKQIPISVNNKKIGYVEGDTFYKIVFGSKHFLRKPPAITYNDSAIEDAKGNGATKLAVYDSEADVFYTADMSILDNNHIKIDYGYGPQLALKFCYWQKHSRKI